MAGCCIRTQNDEEVGESAEGRAVVRLRSAKLSPMICDGLAVLASYGHAIEKIVGPESVG